jgi:hypothetical protein
MKKQRFTSIAEALGAGALMQGAGSLMQGIGALTHGGGQSPAPTQQPGDIGIGG